MNFQGKTAVITGGASGIGAATAKALAECGADLVLLDINEDGLHLKKNELEKYGVKVHIFAVDLTNFEAVQNIGEKINRVCNRIDALANIAGGGGPAGEIPIAQLDRKTWDMLINLNLGTMFNCTRMVIPKMIEQKSGRIVNISSVAGVRGGPMSGKGGYATAKAGIIGFTQTLAREVGQYGIQVNVIAPGLHMTPMTANKPQELVKSQLANIPLGKMGEIEKLARLILFLLSDDNQYITGDLICVDGGLCMH